MINNTRNILSLILGEMLYILMKPKSLSKLLRDYIANKETVMRVIHVIF